jgi:hypothetical protein
MTSSEYLKQNKNTMFQCPVSRCLMSVYACARRYNLAKKTEDKSSWNISEILKNNLEKCMGCKLGEENQMKYKERKGVDLKICPCGEIFHKQPGEKYWSRKKYCDKHSAMNYYERKKDIERILKQKKGGAAVLKELLEEFEEPLKPVEPAPPIEAEKDFLGSAGLNGEVKLAVEKEHKICANEDCGKVFFRKKESQNTWEKKKYCKDKCRKHVENKRKKLTRQSVRTQKKLMLNSDVPEKAAQEKWEELNVLLSILVEDKKTLELIRVAAIKVGKSCYKQAFIDIS